MLLLIMLILICLFQTENYQPSYLRRNSTSLPWARPGLHLMDRNNTRPPWNTWWEDLPTYYNHNKNRPVNRNPRWCVYQK